MANSCLTSSQKPAAAAASTAPPGGVLAAAVDAREVAPSQVAEDERYGCLMNYSCPMRRKGSCRKPPSP